MQTRTTLGGCSTSGWAVFVEQAGARLLGLGSSCSSFHRWTAERDRRMVMRQSCPESRETRGTSLRDAFATDLMQVALHSLQMSQSERH